MSTSGPLVAQSDHTLMLEVQHPKYEECRDFLVSFAELMKSPDFIHTYRVTPLSMWNAAAVRVTVTEIVDGLSKYARYTVPANVITNIEEWHGIFGKLILSSYSEKLLRLEVKDSRILERIRKDEDLEPFWQEDSENSLFIDVGQRGNVKQALIKAGYPVDDTCGYVPGAPLEIELRKEDLDNNVFGLRDYQIDAVQAFYQSGRETGGSGVIVLPCGSGKTIIGLGVMASVSSRTLIVATNNVSVNQWRDELIKKTNASSDQIGEFTGVIKEVKPITITTYQMLIYRRDRNEPMKNLELFTLRDWGLIIYDEVHLLPAPVFRATTEIQARRRLGLTATLIREDGREDDVFALIGPKRYDVPWKVLEGRGFIAEAYCTEYRLPLPQEEEIRYAYADKRKRFRVAAENPQKLELVEQLILNHPDDCILVIGQYISQVEKIAQSLNLPRDSIPSLLHRSRLRGYTHFAAVDFSDQYLTL